MPSSRTAIASARPAAAFLASLLVGATAHGGAPVNDDCTGALPAALGATPYDVPLDATLDAAAPPPTEPTMLNDVWYAWTATTDGVATIATCEGTSGDDTTLEVYAGPCGGLASLASDDDTPGCGAFGFSSTVTVPVTAGTTYHMRIGGWNGGTASGLLEIALETGGACCLPTGLCLVLEAADCDLAGGDFAGAGTTCVGLACPPVNDLCDDALPIAPGDLVSGSTDAATLDAGLPACDGLAVTAPGVWYRTTGTGGTFTASLCNPGTNYDTKLHVLCADCDVFSCVAANDDHPGCGVNPLQSVVSWCTEPGVEYLILVSGFSSATGDFELALADDGMPCTGAPECGAYDLRLEPTDDCYDADDGQVVVEVVLDGSGPPAFGGQFFVEYDASVLQLVSADPGDAPFVTEIYECSTAAPPPGSCTPAPGLLDYAVGVDPGTPGAPGANAGVMARFTFDVLESTCDPVELVSFRDGPLPSRVTDDAGLPLAPVVLVDAPAFSTDIVAPTITFCPPDVLVPADAGFCSAAVSIPFAEASDDCVPPAVTFLRSDDPFLGLTDRFPVGVTTITWFVEDDCGNAVTCATVVEVLPTSELELTVELAANVDTGGAFPQTLVRCIELELARPGCTGPAIVEAEVTFTITDGGMGPNTAIGTALVDVPCGPWTCLSARDPLHTLRRVDAGFGTSGPLFVADLTGAEALVGGELNGDGVIDILDFGAFVFTFGTDYGTGDTTCATAAPHGDVSGDGLVASEDFSFIQVNFLEFGEAACCPLPAPALAAAASAPRTNRSDRRGTGVRPASPVVRIAVDELRRRGLGHYAIADLNLDGWLDGADLAAWPDAP